MSRLIYVKSQTGHKIDTHSEILMELKQIYLFECHFFFFRKTINRKFYFFYKQKRKKNMVLSQIEKRDANGQNICGRTTG